MRSPTFLTLCPLIAGCALLVSGCLGKGSLTQIYPSAADLAVEEKPRLDPAAVDSEAALDAYDVELELWGERGWAAVARLCRFHAQMGMPGLNCPRPREPG
jgi:hypothetical protein